MVTFVMASNLFEIALHCCSPFGSDNVAIQGVNEDLEENPRFTVRLVKTFVYI